MILVSATLATLSHGPCRRLSGSPFCFAFCSATCGKQERFSHVSKVSHNSQSSHIHEKGGLSLNEKVPSPSTRDARRPRTPNKNLWKMRRWHGGSFGVSLSDCSFVPYAAESIAIIACNYGQNLHSCFITTGNSLIKQTTSN